MEKLDEFLAFNNTSKTWTKEKISKLLHNQKMTIIFSKADGTPRTMHCSLIDEDVEPFINRDIPEEDHKKRPDNPNVLTVIDIEKKAWRSFKIDSIIRVMELDYAKTN